MIIQIVDAGAINYEYAIENNYDLVAYLDRLHSILDRINFSVFVDQEGKRYRGHILRRVDTYEIIEDCEKQYKTKRKTETQIIWVYKAVKQKFIQPPEFEL